LGDAVKALALSILATDKAIAVGGNGVGVPPPPPLSLLLHPDK